MSSALINIGNFGLVVLVFWACNLILCLRLGWRILNLTTSLSSFIVNSGWAHALAPSYHTPAHLFLIDVENYKQILPNWKHNPNISPWINRNFIPFVFHGLQDKTADLTSYSS